MIRRHYIHGFVKVQHSAFIGDIDYFKFLKSRLSEKDFLSLLNRPALFSFTPLHTAILCSHPSLIRFFLNHSICLNIQAERGYTPLHLAIITLNHDSVARLVKKDASLDLTDSLGNTPLHWASLLGLHSLSNMLIKSGAKKNVTNLFLATPEDLSQIFGKKNPQNIVGEPHPNAPSPYLNSVICDDDYVIFFYFFSSEKKLKKCINSGRQHRLRNRYGSDIEQSEFLNLYTKEVPEMGIGLFTETSLKKGCFLGEYAGYFKALKTIESEDMARGSKNEYLARCHAFPKTIPYAIDALHGGNLTRFINHQPKFACNVAFKHFWWRGIPRTIAVTTRRIHANEQLFVYYGQKYWEISKKIPVKN